MKKMLKVDAYDPVIYPRMLWVAGQVEGLDKIFIFNKMEDTSEEDPNGYKSLLYESEHGTGVLVTAPVTKKSDRTKGALVIILDWDALQGGDEAHEAVHAADYIFDELGMYTQSFANHNEQYAYLVGWIAGCISKTIIKLKQYDTRRESDDVEDRA